jgi:diguanylate cyclase (GGDEF)-like protein
MRKNIILGYIIFSIILFIALITIYSLRIKSTWDTNFNAVEASFKDYIRDSSSLYSYKEYDFNNYKDSMAELYKNEERLLLFIIYSKSSEGIEYIYTGNPELLQNKNKERINIGWQGKPQYADLPLQRFGTAVLTLPLDIPGKELYADGVYIILGRTDLFGFIVEILIALGAFLVISLIFLILIPNSGSSPEPEKPKSRKRRIIQELDTPIAKESENTGSKNLYSPFTGLGFKENFKKRLNLELKRADSFEHDISVIIISIDRFEYFEEPPLVYSKIGKMILEDFKHQDLIFEYGNAKFILILPAVGLEEGIKRTEYFKNRVSSTQILGQPVTISAGLSSKNEREVNSNILMDEAESALQRAKDSGNNQLFAFKADPDKYSRMAL